ncbi:MAG TPA: hypothetical protein VIN59_00945 [Alphaproteobacteria bacterium]
MSYPAPTSELIILFAAEANTKMRMAAIKAVRKLPCVQKVWHEPKKPRQRLTDQHRYRARVVDGGSDMLMPEINALPGVQRVRHVL